MFTNISSFEGRIRRTEYGISLIISFVISFVVGLLFSLLVSDSSKTYLSTNILKYFLLFPVLLFGIIQGTKRCHDIGVSGWLQFLPFFSIFLIFINSDYGNNKYGPNPKGDCPGVKVISDEELIPIYSKPSVKSSIIIEMKKGDSLFVNFLMKINGFYKASYINNVNNKEIFNNPGLSANNLTDFFKGVWKGVELINTTIIYYYKFKGDTLERNSNYPKMFKKSVVHYNTAFSNNHKIDLIFQDIKLTTSLKINVLNESEIMINDIKFSRIPSEYHGFLISNSKFIKDKDCIE